MAEKTLYEGVGDAASSFADWFRGLDWSKLDPYPVQTWLAETVAPVVTDAVRKVTQWGGPISPYTASGLADPSVAMVQPQPTQTSPEPNVAHFPLGPRQSGKQAQPPARLGDQTGSFLDEANRRRQFFVDKRNEAMKAAGRGAGAPYAAEIARLDAAIAKANRDLGNVGGLFQQKIDNTGAWWDRSIAQLGSSYDESLSNSAQLHATGRSAIDSVYSTAQAHTLSMLANVPGMDEASKIAAVETIGTLEGAIMSMVDVSAEGQAKVMQASENLAVALAKQSKATGTLEFVRQRIMLEEGIKSEVDNMLEQRKSASRAQGAAMSAARQQAAARLPDNWAYDQSSLAQAVGGHYLENAMSGFNDNVQQIVFDTAVQMWEDGVDDAGARQFIKTMDTTGMSWEVANALKKFLPLTIQAFGQGADMWRSYQGADGSAYDVDSAEYAYWLSANNEWMSPEEMLYTITNPTSNQSLYANAQGSTASATTSSSGGTIPQFERGRETR